MNEFSSNNVAGLQPLTLLRIEHFQRCFLLAFSTDVVQLVCRKPTSECFYNVRPKYAVFQIYFSTEDVCLLFLYIYFFSISNVCLLFLYLQCSLNQSAIREVFSLIPFYLVGIKFLFYYSKLLYCQLPTWLTRVASSNT